MQLKPEEEARQGIDALLEKAGWQLQDYKSFNPAAGLGLAVREVPTDTGPADYILFVDRKAVGVIEAKKEGKILTGVEEQSARYACGFPENIPHVQLPLPFVYESTGVETHFTNNKDPNPRARRVFAFHKPETLKAWADEDQTLRSRLQTNFPELIKGRLRDCQFEAITNLEKSFEEDRPRALIQMATGAGKTFTAISFIYRLIKFSKAKRVLFLVDRSNLGEQTHKEFQQFVTPDDGRKFTDLYIAQRLTSNKIDKDCKVCITTIQRLYSMLRGDEELGEGLEQVSSYEFDDGEGRTKDVAYNPTVPIEAFDFIVTDECHRSIYNLWRQVLEYFDGHLIGLTATPSAQTMGFFNKNLVMDYSHEKAVKDGVNVSFNVYRIRTQITEKGSTIDSGAWISRRSKETRELKYEELDDELAYEGKQLDRAVVAMDQIRTVIRTYKERLFDEIYPGRHIVPKTLIFAKSDAHADDIIKIVREEFGKGNDFCKKITYKIDEDPKSVTNQFRNNFNPRIAVTVDLISTGTDIKPLEVLIFMRDVKSINYYQQMLGRGTRIINDTDLQEVTSDAVSKTHFVVVDAVGVTESPKPEMQPTEPKKSVGFGRLMQQIAMGDHSREKLNSLAKRLETLDKKLDEDAQRNMIHTAGKSVAQVANDLRAAAKPENHKEEAKRTFNTLEPSKAQIDEVATELKRKAVAPIENPKVREMLEDKKQKADQVIDEVSIDTLVDAGFDEQATERAKEKIGNFKRFIEENKDTVDALQILYNQPHGKKGLTYKAIKEVSELIKKPPYLLDTHVLWSAYEQVEKDKVKQLDNPRNLTNLVSLLRHTLGQAEVLEPFRVSVEEKFKGWLKEQGEGRFGPEQLEWLGMIKEHVAASVDIQLSDLKLSPFDQKGGAMGAYKVFGNDLQKIIEELQGVLAA